MNNNLMNAAEPFGRLPLLHPAELTDEQAKLYQHFQEHLVGWSKQADFTLSLTDGRLLGPLNAFLYSPVLSQAYHHWVDTERQYTSIPPRIRTLLILTVGAAWESAFEIYAHSIAAKAIGLDAQVIAALAAGRQPENLSALESAAYNFASSLLQTKRVDDETYRVAVAHFTEKGVVDMLQLIGVFLTVSIMLNTFEIPTPEAAGVG